MSTRLERWSASAAADPVRPPTPPGWQWCLTTGAAVLLLGAGCSDRSDLSPPNSVANAQGLAQVPRCNADRVANAVGQWPTPELLEAARSGAGARDVRTLAHDQPVSSTYRAELLNLVLDTEGRIGSVNCG